MVDLILKKRNFAFHFWVTMFTGGIWLFIYLLAYIYQKYKDYNLKKYSKIKSEKRIAQHSEYINNKQLLFQERLNNVNICEIKLNSNHVERNPVKDFPSIKFSNITSKTIKDRISDFVVIDLETTGLSAGKNEIIEISAIRFSSFQSIEKMTTLIKPKHEITADITKINGITNNDVASAPSIAEVISAFNDFIGNSNLVGHNLIFDLKFLHANGFGIFETKRKYFDTLELSKRALKDEYMYDFKLGTVAENYDIYIPNAHRAEHDAFATGLIFKELAEDLTI